jgi:cardiolipin synthase
MCSKRRSAVVSPRERRGGSPLRYRKPDGRSRVLSVPNVLSLSRLVLLPFFVLTLARELHLISFLFLLVIGLTDVADGYLARRYGLVTDLGKILDHLGDKLVNVIVMYALSAFRGLPLWAFWVVAAREVLFVLGGVVLARSRRTVVQSNPLGKTGGIVMFASWILFLFGVSPWSFLLLYGALGIMFVASLSYVRHYLLARMEG